MQINKAEIPERRKQRGKQTGKKKAERKEAKHEEILILHSLF